MDVIYYFKEKEKICGSFTFCDSCPFWYENNGENVFCDDLERNNPEKAVEIVEKYDYEHSIREQEEFYE